MAGSDLKQLLAGELLEDETELSLADLCRACRLSADQVIELVQEGIIEPVGQNPARWRFEGICVHRVRTVMRLEQDLGVNIAGAALALELLDELERLRTRLQRLDQ